MQVAPALAAPAAELVAEDARRALREDVGSGDVTAALLPVDALARARVVVKEHAVLAGRPWFDACFAELDARVAVRWRFADGDRLSPGDVVCEIEGSSRAIVTGERSALNFLQTLSGTATTTAAYVAAVAGSRTTVLDTRKTLPGLRLAQKYAVRCGGGSNHRIGLFDAILIKENHIAAAGSLAAAVERARAIAPGLLLEVEVESIEELEQALAARADRVLLDELSHEDLRRAVALAGGRCALEVSGGVSLDTIGAIAATGVDFVSVGALTKHVRATDYSLRVISRA